MRHLRIVEATPTSKDTDNKSDDRLVRLITETNIVALDKILARCQQTVNFSAAADHATRINECMMRAVHELSLIMPSNEVK